MKSVLKGLLPQAILEKLIEVRAFADWRNRGWLENAPQFVKERIFLKYGVPDAQWVETGTYLGTTTAFLEKYFPKIYSIEPSHELYKKALKRFSGKNVELINETSENSFPVLLPELAGDCNFWLDGHYSAGVTFKGSSDCPVENELGSIEENLANFSKVAILIDDVRCFLPFNQEYHSYPSTDFLVDWARKNGFNWRVEQDIFIMRNFS